MDAPLGITFLKKVEIYQKIQALDNQYAKMAKDEGVQSHWPNIRKVLAWTYVGHKNIGSPIKTDHFSRGSTECKLDEFVIDKVSGNLTKLLDAFIVLGFANQFIEGKTMMGKETNENEIYISKEGFLAGEVLEEMESPLKRTSFWIWGNLWGHFGGFILLLTLIIFWIELFVTLLSHF